MEPEVLRFYLMRLWEAKEPRGTGFLEGNEMPRADAEALELKIMGQKGTCWA